MDSFRNRVIADLAWLVVSAIIAIAVFVVLIFNYSIPLSRGTVLFSDYGIFIFLFIILFCYVTLIVFYIRTQQSGFKRLFPFVTAITAGTIVIALLYPLTDLVTVFLQMTIYPPLSALGGSNENKAVSESAFMKTRFVMHSFQFFVFLVLLYFSYRFGKAKSR